MGERSPKQIKDKLVAYGLSEEEVGLVLLELTELGFVNQERFARAFANDKFKFNKWGKLKISHELRKHDLDADTIAIGLDYISEEDYLVMVQELILEKWKSLNAESDHFNRQAKTMRYLIQKGFELGLVTSEMKKVISKTKF
jgi:regulatory protein